MIIPESSRSLEPSRYSGLAAEALACGPSYIVVCRGWTILADCESRWAVLDHRVQFLKPFIFSRLNRSEGLTVFYLTLDCFA